MFRKVSRCLWAGSLAVLSAELSAADMVTLQPVDDAHISNIPGESNLPWDTAELVQFGYYGSIKRPLLKFDLSSIPDGATVLSAELTLQLVGLYGGQGHFTSAWRVPNDNWAEETVTWDSYDRTGAVSVAILPGASQLGTRVWNIRIADWTYADDLLDNAVTFMMRWDDSGGLYETDGYYKANSYSSKEGTVAPTLTLTTQLAQFLGDMDCDGDVDFDDINPFVLALSDPAAYLLAYPDCNILNGDCDADGDVDFDDINPFVALLSGQ